MVPLPLCKTKIFQLILILSVSLAFIWRMAIHVRVCVAVNNFHGHGTIIVHSIVWFVFHRMVFIALRESR